MKSSRSFKKELIYSFLIIVLVVIALLGVFQIFQLSSLINENQKGQAQTTKFLEDYIVNYVEEHRRAIETMASSIKNTYEKNDIQSIEKQLKDVKENYPGFVNLYVGNQKGESIAFYPEVFQDGEKRKNIDFSDRDYYKDLVKEKETVISAAFPGRGGTYQQLITIATPLLGEKDNFEGYLLGAIDLTVLEDHIKNRNFGKEGYAVVLDQDNNVIVHPTIRAGEEFVNLSEADIVKYIDEHDDYGGQYFEQEKKAKEYITYETVDDLGWTIWVGKPASVITNTYKNAIITIIVFILITAVIMVGVSFILTNRFEKTIKQLLHYIKDYTKHFGVKKGFRDKFRGPKEMEELSVHFDQMIDEIEKNRTELLELNTDLEERVQLRTEDLEHKNSELKAVNKLITSVSSDTDLAHFVQECLRKIEPYIHYSIHVLFQDMAITSSYIMFDQQLEMYKKEQMKGDYQHIEPIQIRGNSSGKLIADLTSHQRIDTEGREFLQTFASSLAIVLQNKLLFERFRNKHAELEAVLESMSEGLMLLNNQREVEYVNEYFLNAIKGKQQNIDDLNVLEDVFSRMTILYDVTEEQLTSFFHHDEVEMKLERKEITGETRFYLLYKFSVTIDDSRIGEGLVLRDITKEEEIDTLKNNLISLTSHEFKTPITNIKGSVETLLRSEVTWDPEFQQELLEGVHEDTERIEHLVSDWMDISKIESGAMYVEPNMIRADYVIKQSLDQIPDDLCDNARLQFHNHVKGNTFVYADKLRVQQVLVNLFTNALRYNDEPIKEIDVTLEKNENYLTISVADNGIGISRDHLSKIFNRFYQVDITATRRSGGTGLGLAICKGIMHAHKGEIEVHSEPGKGTTFILYFPLERES